MVEYKINGRPHSYEDIIQRAKDSRKFHFMVPTKDPSLIVDCAVYGTIEWSITEADSIKSGMRGSLESVMGFILKWNPSYFLFYKDSNVEISGCELETISDEEIEKRITSMKAHYEQYHKYLDEINFRDSLKDPMKRSHDEYLDMLKEYKKYNRRFEK